MARSCPLPFNFRDMLVGRIPFLRCTHRIAQYSTKATANYDSFKKLRGSSLYLMESLAHDPPKAFPFETTPEEAQRTMGKAAVHICNKLGFLASVMAIFFPSSNILRPVRFSAAYFPAWIVNAEIEVDMKYDDTRVTTLISLSLTTPLNLPCSGGGHLSSVTGISTKTLYPPSDL